MNFKKSKNNQYSPSKNNFQKNKAKNFKQQGDASWIYGLHPVKEALLNKKRKIFKLLILEKNKAIFDDFFKENNLNINQKAIHIVQLKEILSHFNSTNIVHQGCALLCSNLEFQLEHDFLYDLKKEKSKTNAKTRNILILDQVTDPHNIGAIIRTSVAFGITDIILHKQSFSGQNATICKSASGAFEKANLVISNNISNLILQLKDLEYWVVGLDGKGNDEISQMKEYPKICLIIGSEGLGIRNLVKKNCDLLFKIPISQDVESLNASNAVAIALWELVR